MTALHASQAGPARPSRPAGTSVVVVAVAGLAVLAGLASLLAGTLRATVWAPASSTSVRVAAPAAAPVLVGVPALLARSGRDGQVTVTTQIRVAAGTPAAPVFVGIARTSDAQAYLGPVARVVLSSVEGDGDSARPDVSARDGEASLPDPAGVDVWAAFAAGNGTATLEWPATAGDWELVVASDGHAAAPAVDLTWHNSPRSSGAPAFVAVGAVLLVLGLLGLAVWSRAVRSPAPAGRPTAPAGPAPAPAPAPASVGSGSGSGDAADGATSLDDDAAVRPFRRPRAGRGGS